MNPCNAVQYGDQMLCKACGRAWGVNGPYPSECKGQRCRSCGHPAKQMVMNQDDDLCVGCWLDSGEEKRHQPRLSEAVRRIFNHLTGK